MKLTENVEIVKKAVYNLQLTKDELITLAAVCGNIGGKFDSPIRQLTDKIYYDIEKALQIFDADTFKGSAHGIIQDMIIGEVK